MIESVRKLLLSNVFAVFAVITVIVYFVMMAYIFRDTSDGLTVAAESVPIPEGRFLVKDVKESDAPQAKPFATEKIIVAGIRNGYSMPAKATWITLPTNACVANVIVGGESKWVDTDTNSLEIGEVGAASSVKVIAWCDSPAQANEGVTVICNLATVQVMIGEPLISSTVTDDNSYVILPVGIGLLALCLLLLMFRLEHRLLRAPVVMQYGEAESLSRSGLP